jgi:ribosomal protein S18 acetylase RimI-like enzyme
MPAAARILTIEPLACADIVAVAQCIAIDADVFPFASAQFGLRSASARIWVAREFANHRDDTRSAGDRGVVGFVATRGRLGVLHVDGLAVDSALRRHGIGRALMREAVKHAHAEGMRAVALRVSVANGGAIALYRAEGFVVEGRLGGFYPAAAFHGEADAYAMVLLLD